MDSIWPRMGWRRLARYNKYRLIRIQDTDRNIAVGLSWGAAVSFSPLIGTHILQGLLYTWLMRGNLAASVVGTFWGNPWTGPLMQWFSYETGKTFFRTFGFASFATLPEEMNIGKFLEYVLAHPFDLFLPWVIGGFLAALIVWPFFYLFHFWLIRSARIAQRKTRHAAHHHRQHRLAAAASHAKGAQTHHAHHRNRH